MACARPVGALLADVAHGGDAAAGNLQEVLDVAAALQTDADHADAHRVDRRRGEEACGCGLRGNAAAEAGSGGRGHGPRPI